MPEGDSWMSALAIDGHGFLVVGGQYKANRAFLLRGDMNGDVDQKWKWEKLPPMNLERQSPGIAFFEGSVYVASRYLFNIIECLRFPTCKHTEFQWTILYKYGEVGGLLMSLFVADGKLFLHGK